jgi:hypothetical protein
MLFLKCVILTAAIGFFMTAVLVVVFEAQRVWRLSHTMGLDEWPAPRPLLWRKAGRLVAVGCLVMFPALGMIVIPSRMARADVSTVSRTLPDPRYATTHAVAPPVHRVETFDTRVLSSRPCTRVGR